MGFPTVKKQLNAMSKEEIINLLGELYKDQPLVKTWDEIENA